MQGRRCGREILQNLAWASVSPELHREDEPAKPAGVEIEAACAAAPPTLEGL
jgi:hypothetical protein